ncbi:MAG: fructose-1,6-bisphosphatase/inositol monophosphatase family enzyme [Cellvibrionaceae bacterium]
MNKLQKKTSFEKTFTSETIEMIIQWLKQSGEIALNQFENSKFSYKADQSFVTQADLEIEQFLTQKIKQNFPIHEIIGEESTAENIVQLESEFVWTIDPIDGTTAFIQGLPGWGVAIGLLYCGRPKLGFYYMPLLDDLTYVNQNGDVYCKGKRLTSASLQSKWDHKGFLALTTAANSDFDIKIKYLRALGSNMTNLVYTARGTAVATFIPKAYLWDMVAGAAILAGLGGEFWYLDGQSVDFKVLLNQQLAPLPIVAGHPDVLNSLIYLIDRKATE